MNTAEEIAKALQNVTQTVEGYPVKNLTWLPNDNVIRGQVKCPVVGKPNLHDGYIIVTWRKNGTLMGKWGGNTRPDLYLDLSCII